MSRVRSKDTQPEMTVRSFLHGAGLRYRLHDHSLPGKPDLVFPSRGVVVFVHGCFWHGHAGCKKAGMPKSRQEYWRSKIQANAERDDRVIRELQESGWRVLVVWQCEICPESLGRLSREIQLVPKTGRPRRRVVSGAAKAR